MAAQGRSQRGTQLVLPVRFVAAGQAVQCTTRELSVLSAFVSCARPPPAGAPLSLRLYLPGGKAPEAIDAIARAPLGPTDERGTGFWADFLPGHDEALARIAELLVRVAQERGQHAPGVDEPAFEPPDQRPARRPPPEVTRPRGRLAPRPFGAERRVDRRVEGATLPVRFATVEDFLLEYAANLSAGGVFIRTDSPPPLGTAVKVLLELPDGGPPIEVDGVVLHRLEPHQAGPSREPGVGVQFARTDAELGRRIESFLDSVLDG